MQWRILLPDSLPAFRRATAAFLHFAASPGDGPFRCAPVSAAERAAARADTSLAGEAGRSHSSSSSDSFSLGRGWFGAVAAASDGAAGSGAAAAAAGGYAWQLAERLYSSAQYALAFQLALAPEVGEEELAELGPEWVSPATLLALQVRAWLGAREGSLLACLLLLLRIRSFVSASGYCCWLLACMCALQCCAVAHCWELRQHRCSDGAPYH